MRARRPLLPPVILLLAAMTVYSQTEPETSFLRETLVCRHLARGETDQAIAILVQEGTRSPFNLNVKLYLGFARYLQKDVESALKELNAIRTELDKMQTSARPMGDPEMFLMMGLDRKSQAFLDKDKEGYFHYILGLTLKDKGDFKAAEKAFRKAQSAKFDKASIALSLADLYLSMENLKNASREVEELNKLSGRTPLVAFYEAYLAHKKGRDEESLAAFEKIATAIPEAEKNTGFIHYNQGRFDKALEIWADILALSPDDADALLNAGRASFHLGQAEKAQEYFDRAGIKILPSNYSPVKLALIQSPAEPELKPPCGR